MTQPMTREQEIQTEALLVLAGGLQNDPFFYAVKQNMRRKLKPTALIEFDTDSVLVIDNDMTEHRF